MAARQACGEVEAVQIVRDHNQEALQIIRDHNQEAVQIVQDHNQKATRWTSSSSDNDGSNMIDRGSSGVSGSEAAAGSSIVFKTKRKNKMEVKEEELDVKNEIGIDGEMVKEEKTEVGNGSGVFVSQHDSDRPVNGSSGNDGSNGSSSGGSGRGRNGKLSNGTENGSGEDEMNGKAGDGERGRDSDGDSSDRPLKRIKVEGASNDSVSSSSGNGSLNYNGGSSDGVRGSSSNSGIGNIASNIALDNDSTNLIIKNEFGNELVKISFKEDMWNRLLVPLSADEIIDENIKNSSNNIGNGDHNSNCSNGLKDLNKIDLFHEREKSSYGVKYNFSLKDKAEEAAVDAPEWLVPQVNISNPLIYF